MVSIEFFTFIIQILRHVVRHISSFDLHFGRPVNCVGGRAMALDTYGLLLELNSLIYTVELSAGRNRICGMELEKTWVIQIGLNRAENWRVTLKLTLTAAWTNPVGIEWSKLRIGMDRRMSSTVQRRRAKFSIWPHRWVANRPTQSNRKTQLGPSTRNSWTPIKPFSLPQSFRLVTHAVPPDASPCPAKSRCEHSKWQLCRKRDHWRQLSTANKHCRANHEPPLASKCWKLKRDTK